MVISAYHTQPLPPSGAAHAVALHLTPTSKKEPSSSRASSRYHSHSRGALVCHLVTARDDVVDIYEVRQKQPSIGSSTSSAGSKLYHVRSHAIFGKVTGLARCRVGDDGKNASQSGASASSASSSDIDTLVISFADAKMALMQWSDSAADLVTVSIHTYERSEQLAEGLPARFIQLLRADPGSRCAALLLPQDTLAVLPFYSDTAEELDQLLEQAGNFDKDLSFERSLPYAPSFLLDLKSVDPSIRNIRDFVFLPNFQQPTIAVLFEREATWTGRLNEHHDTCAVRIITLDLSISTSAQHRVISSKDALPSDCLYLTACPQSLGGGILLATSAALLYMDQNGRTVGLAVSGWHALTSKVPLPVWKKTPKSLANGASEAQVNGNGHTQAQGELNLTGSHVVFPDHRLAQALLLLENGHSWLVDCMLEGRSLSSMNLKERDETTVPSLVAILPDEDAVFVGSMVGPSQLHQVAFEEKAGPAATASANKDVDELDMDLDEDLYGKSTMDSRQNSDGKWDRLSRTGEIRLRLLDEVRALGPVLHACPTVVTDGSSASGLSQTVICSGSAPYGGLTLLEPQIVPRRKKQLPLAASESLYLVHHNQDSGEKILLASAPQMTEMSTIDKDGMVVKSLSLEGRTVFAKRISTDASPLTILRVTRREIELLDEEGKQQAVSPLGDDRVQEIDIYKAEHCAGYLTLLWTDGSLDLIRVLPSSIEPSELPDSLQSQKYVSAGLLEDRYHHLKWATSDSSDDAMHSKPVDSVEQHNATKSTRTRGFDEDEEEIDYGEDDLDTPLAGNDDARAPLLEAEKAKEGVSNGGASPLWLVLTSSEACVQIFSMDDLANCVWQSNSLYPAPARLDFVATATEDADVPSLELSHVQLCNIGDVVHLVAAYENGLVNVFEAVAFGNEDEESARARKEVPGKKLALSFVKILARELDVENVSGILSNDTSATSGLTLTPFDSLHGQCGLFIGGASPAWLLRSECGLTRLCMSAEAPMTSFDANPMPGDDSIVYTQYGMVCVAQMPDLDFTFGVPSQKKARTGRTYTKAAPHPYTKTIVAASALPQEFVLFDPEDGHVIEEPGSDPSAAYSMRGALELFADGEQEPLDGYEFDQCEVVTCVELVTLRSRTSVSGLKDFIAVGTIFSHGEDRPARGATYIFDISEVVAPPNDPGNRFKLRLLVKDDAKGPITAITDVNGYLVVIMGLKLFVRSLEKDEWLITIAFLDTPFLATGVQRLKNFILLTDVKRSVWLVAFQEEPYRLVVVSKDYNLLHAVTGSFLLKDGDTTLAVTSHDGILRLFNYSPSVPASQGGQRLLVRSEYDMAAEASCVMVIPGSPSRDGGISTSSELVYGMMNGAIQTLQPVDEDIFNTLHLLQGQLVRNVQHFAGLNPRGFRAVRNELAARPLAKGVLDGRLLAAFEMLPRPKMEELAKLVPDLVDGSDQLLRYLATLRSNWGMQ